MYDNHKFAADVLAIRQRSPLVHNITNFVVMNNTANALLALGASPVMAHARQEVAQMATAAAALVVNIGTLSDHWVDAMEIAMRAAAAAGVPIVYDPVGAGATDYRRQVNARLLAAVGPTIIRGNASEIMALAEFTGGCHGNFHKDDDGGSEAGRGVDSTQASSEAVNAARALSAHYDSVVVVSGEVDYIVRGDTVYQNLTGVPLMSRVTGMGCTASAICGAFAAVNADPFETAIGAMRCMGECGERAFGRSAGPGSFQVAFIDELYSL